MTSWLTEVLHGVRKRDDTAGTELRNITIVEASGVDHPASGFENWLLLKSADRKLKDLSDDELDNRIADYDRAHLEEPYDDSLASDLAALRAEKTRRQQGGIRKSEFPGLANLSVEDLQRLQEWCKSEPEQVEKALRRLPKGWGQRLTRGQRIVFSE